MKVFTLVLLALFAVAPASGQEAAKSAAGKASAVATKTTTAIERGARKTGDAVERGAKKTGAAVNRGAKKLGLPTDPPASAPQ